MSHASSRTFINHYRPRRHVGLQEIMCGLNPNEELSRAVTRTSRWIDRRRPRYLNDAERASVEKDPELQSAIRRQVELKSRCTQSDDPALRRYWTSRCAMFTIRVGASKRNDGKKCAGILAENRQLLISTADRRRS
jgi:hypothetical protein